MNTGDGGGEGGMHMVHSFTILIQLHKTKKVSFTHILSLDLVRQLTQIHILQATALVGDISVSPLV